VQREAAEANNSVAWAALEASEANAEQVRLVVSLRVWRA
jgi:hypothetical protein